MRYCFYQIFKVKAKQPFDWGNCSVCVTDDLNWHCKGYFPITVVFYEVEEVDDDTERSLPEVL
jgi:hypothetical protein